MKIDTHMAELINSYQYINSVTYAKTNERIYCNLKICCIVAFVYRFVMSFLLILGMMWSKQPLGNSYLTATVISVILLVAAFVLMFFKLNLISLILNITGIALQIPLIINGLILNAGVVDIKPAFYWQHLIPDVLLIVICIWMCIISTREKYLIRRDKKAVITQIYNKYCAENDKTDSDRWNEYLSNFNPENVKPEYQIRREAGK